MSSPLHLWLILQGIHNQIEQELYNLKNHLSMKRRNFLNAVIALPAVSTAGKGFRHLIDGPSERAENNNRLKISLNAYSFNKPLLDGRMDLNQLLEFCAEQGFFAVDIPGYYFKGYPEVPVDEYIYEVKRYAFLKGIDISGTGVRNDFTYTEEAKRKEGILLVKNWIDVAAKLGAPVIRIFAGNQGLEGHSWEQAAEWIVRDILECVECGKNQGVIVAIQNHDDFIKTANQALRILEMVNSAWFGLILDTGSYRQGDPYDEVAKTADYAVNWQIKEEVYFNQNSEKVDLIRLFKIIKASDYRGYLPLETLGEGDPFVKVSSFMKRAKEALEII
jgi:sugar phosphate isomerase/epimerase